MFVDASAIVAILTAEPERSAPLDALDEAEAPITSVLAIFEAVVAVCCKKMQSVIASETQVREFLAT